MPGMLNKLKERWHVAGDAKKSVAINVVWRALATGVNKIARLLVLLYAANRLGPAGFGLYSYVISLATLAFMFSDWGINILLTRDFHTASTDVDRERLLSTSLILKIGIGLLSTAAIPFILLWQGKMSLLPFALLFAATMLIGNIRDISISLFLAVQKARLEFVVYVVETIGIVVGYVVIFRAAPTALSLFFVYAFATLVSAVCAFLFGSGIARFRSGRFTWVLGKQILRNGLPLSLFGIATYLFFSADQLIVEYYHGLREVGIYNVGTRIVLAVAVVPGLLNSVVLPHLSRHREDPVKIKKIILYCLGLLVGGASLFSCGIFLLGPWIIQRFFSVEFWPIIPLLGPLSLMTVPLFAVSLFDYVLISYNLQKQDFYLTLAAGVVNVALNFGLVPRYGIAGAVGASVASQFINAFLTCGYMVRVLNRAARPVSAPNF